MKRIITIIALLLTSCLLLNGQEHLKFKNIPIDGTVTSFISKLKAAGLKHYSDTGINEVLDGTFAGMNNCKVIFASSDKTKTVFRVAVITENEVSWRSLKNTYNTVKETYNNKYGEGRSYEFFEDPYYEGDGFEFQALRRDKCTYATFYTTPEGNISIQMKGSSTSSEGYLLITYEDDKNFDKAKEEREATVIDDI